MDWLLIAVLSLLAGGAVSGIAFVTREYYRLRDDLA
jgi:hypothetical protein